MPPRKEREDDVAERLDKELRQRVTNIREEFDKVESNVRENSHLENPSDEIKGFQSKMWARFGVLRNRYYNEADIILSDLKDEIRKAMPRQGKQERTRRGSERLVNSSGPDPRAVEREGEKDDVGTDNAGKKDVTQNSGQTVSKIAGATTRKRTKIDKSAPEVQNRKNLPAIGSAAGLVPKTAPISTVEAGTGFATVSDASAALDSSTGPAANAAPDSAAGSAAALVARPVTRSVADSAAGSAELTGRNKSDRLKQRDAAVTQNVETTASQPRRRIKTFQIGGTRIIVKGPTRPSTRGTHGSAGHDTSTQDHEIDPDAAIVEESREPEAIGNLDINTDSAAVVPIHSHGKARKKTKKRKSKATKKTSLMSQIFESDTSDDPTENDESAVEDKRKKKSKQKQTKPISPETIEVEPNEVNNNNKDATADGKRKKSKTVKENAPNSGDGVEIMPNADLNESIEEIPADGKSKISKKMAKKVAKNISAAAEEVQRLDGGNQDATTDARKKKSKATKKNMNKSTCTEVDEIQPTEDQVGKKDNSTSDDNENIEGERKIREAESTAKPTSAGGIKASSTPEEQSITDTEERAPETPLRRSGRSRKPSQRMLESAGNRRESRRP